MSNFRCIQAHEQRVISDALRRAASTSRATAVEANTPTSKLGIDDTHIRSLLELAHKQDALAAEIEHADNIILEKL